MKPATKISSNFFSLVETQEEKALWELEEATKGIGEENKEDEKRRENVAIIFAVFAIIIIYCIYLANKRGKKEEKQKNEKAKKKIFHLIERYKLTKNTSSLKELKDFLDLKGITATSQLYEKIYFIIERLKKIISYKNAVLSYLKSLLSPINKRDYHRRKFRCLFKNLDDEHSFNVILN